jgi:hypothetical protein
MTSPTKGVDEGFTFGGRPPPIVDGGASIEEQPPRCTQVVRVSVHNRIRARTTPFWLSFSTLLTRQ